MEHINTNKITIALFYAVLEWTLILLLLLNSLFSFLIIKFSQFFALKPPCFWCSTLHRFLEPQNLNSHTDLLCEIHSKEVSSLGFCPNHNKLAEIRDLCEDCFSSHLGFQSEVKQDDEGEQNLNCSCCGLKFEKKSIDDSLLTLSPWDVKNADLVLGIERKMGSDDQIGSGLMKGSLEIQSRKQNPVNFDGKGVWDSNTFEIETHLNEFEKREDSTSEFVPQDLEFFFDFSGSQLVPIELVDSTTEESQNISEADEDHEFGNYQKPQILEAQQKPTLESMELEETENSIVFHAKKIEITNENSAIVEETRAMIIDTEEHEENAAETDEFDPNTHLVHEEAEVSTGTAIPVVEEPLTNSHDLHLKIENGFEPKNSSGDCNEIEEEKIPNTPGSVESLNQLHKKLLTIERKESGAEESFDGSVMSDIEMDSSDPISTVEKLKLALKAERKALQALYTELEEERGASEVATSETMAMINRLHEEKAAMQMEALHYQRMMEEQAEYDQEALQLLNELMIKREKELEFYRKKVADYEAKERMRFSPGSIPSPSDDGDGDGMPTDTNNEANGNQESWHPNILEDSMLDLDTSLADFEEERLSILDQLKVLEVKLFALSDEEEEHFADIRPIEDFYEENAKIPENGFDTIDSPEKVVVPLYDTINGFNSEKMENDKKRIDIEEEVDQVYGRLQALEADREFLKHCVGSLKKGEKGMELLQEILQHLRELRTMDLQR